MSTPKHPGKTFTTATHKTEPHPLDPKQFAPTRDERVTAAPADGGRVSLSVDGLTGRGHTTLTPADARELGQLLVQLADEAEKG